MPMFTRSINGRVSGYSFVVSQSLTFVQSARHLLCLRPSMSSATSRHYQFSQLPTSPGDPAAKKNYQGRLISSADILSLRAAARPAARLVRHAPSNDAELGDPRSTNPRAATLGYGCRCSDKRLNEILCTFSNLFTRCMRTGDRIA